MIAPRPTPRCYHPSLLQDTAAFADAVAVARAALRDRPSLRNPSMRRLIDILLVVDAAQRAGPRELAEADVFAGARHWKTAAPKRARDEAGIFATATRHVSPLLLL